MKGIWKKAKDAIRDIFVMRLEPDVRSDKWKTLSAIAGIWLFYTLFYAVRGTVSGAAEFSPEAAAVLSFCESFKSSGLWLLLRPDISLNGIQPPFYYLLYVPLINYLRFGVQTSALIVNSLFFLITLYSLYILLRKTQSKLMLLCAAALTGLMPGFSYIMLFPSPVAALCAFLMFSFAALEASEGMNNKLWTALFTFSSGLGFYSHNCFWVYFAVLAYNARKFLLMTPDISAFLLPFIIMFFLNSVWYAKAFVCLLLRIEPLRGSWHGFFSYWSCLSGYAGPVITAAGLAALAAMFFFRISKTDIKKELLLLTLLPWLLFSIGVSPDDPSVFVAAAFPPLIALSYMVPYRYAGYALCLILMAGAVCISTKQTIPDFTAEKGPYATGDIYRRTSAQDLKNITSAVDSALRSRSADISVLNGDSSSVFNPLSLRLYAKKNFYSYRLSKNGPADSQIIIYTHKRAYGGNNLSIMRDFTKTASVDLRNGGTADIYVSQKEEADFPEQNYLIKVNSEKFSSPKAVLKLRDFNSGSGLYRNAYFSSLYSVMDNIYIYNLSLRLKDLRLKPGSDVPEINSAGAVKINYATADVKKFLHNLKKQYAVLRNAEITLSGNCVETGISFLGSPVIARWKPEMNGSALFFRLKSLKILSVPIPETLLRPFGFLYGMKNDGFDIEISSVKINNGMVEIS